MGTIILSILMITEAVLLVWSIRTKQKHRKEKCVVRFAEFFGILLLFLVGTLEWGFRYYAIILVLFINMAVSLFVFIKENKGQAKERPFRVCRTIVSFFLMSILFTMALFIAILCPQYRMPKITGTLEVATKTYTWIDHNRIEEFSKTPENRSLTVQFWYPQEGEGNYPLVVFSHGAFGLRDSNTSTYMELASNGYVVCAIDHTYHAMVTQNASGKTILSSQDFVQEIYDMNAGLYSQEEQFALQNKWLKLRTEDQDFILDTIIEKAGAANEELVFQMVDTEKIGLIGHSLGGASSAKLGRERNDIDAVVDLDGTMMGEEIGVKDNTPILIEEPYPIPLLNLYTESHFNDAKRLAGDEYDNFHASKGAEISYDIVFKNAGHLNFTDLPLFSPLLAKMLGVGTIDKYYSVETMNDIVLQFFNCYLKGGNTPQFAKEY